MSWCGASRALQGSQASTASANLSVDERTECLLDLHGLHAKEAVELTERFLLGLEAEGIQGLAYLAIGKANTAAGDGQEACQGERLCQAVPQQLLVSLCGERWRACS